MKITHEKHCIVCENNDTLVIFVDENEQSLKILSNVLKTSSCKYKGIKYCDIEEYEHFFCVNSVLQCIKEVKNVSELLGGKEVVVIE